MSFTGKDTGLSVPLRSSFSPEPEGTVIGAVTRSRVSCADRLSWNMSLTLLIAFSVFSTLPSMFLYPPGMVRFISGVFSFQCQVQVRQASVHNYQYRVEFVV